MKRFFLLLLLSACLCAQVPQGAKDASTPELFASASQAYKARQYETAVELLKLVVDREPKHKLAWNNLGLAYVMLGQTKEAVASFQKQIEINPFDPWAYNNLGNTYLTMGKEKEAEEALRKQIEINPLDEWAHKNLGRLLVQTKRYKEAVEELEIATRIDPKDAFVRGLLGMAYIESGEKEKGQALLEEARHDAAPSNVRRSGSDPVDMLIDRTISPDVVIQKAIAKIDRLKALMSQADPKSYSAEDITRSNALAAMWAVLGDAYLRNNDLPAAERHLRASWKWNESAVVAELLGDVYQKEGKQASALESYKQAYGLTTRNHDRIHEKLEKMLGSKARVSEFLRKMAIHLSPRNAIISAPLTTKKGSAEFLVVFSGNGKVERATYRSGDEILKGVEGKLPSLKYSIEFPEVLEVKMVRPGLLYCGMGCSFVLMPADNFIEMLPFLTE